MRSMVEGAMAANTVGGDLRHPPFAHAKPKTDGATLLPTSATRPTLGEESASFKGVLMRRAH